MKHSRNSQQIQGDFQDFEAPAPAEPEYAGEVTMALPPVPRSIRLPFPVP